MVSFQYLHLLFNNCGIPHFKLVEGLLTIQICACVIKDDLNRDSTHHPGKETPYLVNHYQLLSTVPKCRLAEDKGFGEIGWLARNGCDEVYDV